MDLRTRNFVLFKTDLFVFGQDAKDIDQWCVGGDCAGWFYARLLPVTGIKGLYAPAMEDWGWIFEVSSDSVCVRVNVWAFFIDNCWLFGVEAKRRLLSMQSSESLLHAKDVVCDALQTILSGDARITKHAWFGENPFDMDLKDF